MQTPYVKNALTVGLTVLAILLFLGHTILFLTKGVQPWYYGWFASPVEQWIAFLTIPIGLMVAWSAKNILK